MVPLPWSDSAVTGWVDLVTKLTEAAPLPHLRRCVLWRLIGLAVTGAALALRVGARAAFRSTVAARVIPGVLCSLTVMMWRLRVTEGEKIEMIKVSFTMATETHPNLQPTWVTKCAHTVTFKRTQNFYKQTSPKSFLYITHLIILTFNIH